MIIRIYEGESALAKENQMLAQFKFYGIPPAPKGVPQIEIILDIDVNNFLTVSVQDKLTGIKQIVNNLNDESHWLFKREVNNKEEEEEEEKISVKQQLLNFCYSIKLCLEDVKVSDF
uniref:Uncharacterized protein n=1 Tax=Panagrolaimus superbus TaxID=310955 RepID=A0A914YC00_9BILA